MDGATPPSDLTQGISTPASAKSSSSTFLRVGAYRRRTRWLCGSMVGRAGARRWAYSWSRVIRAWLIRDIRAGAGPCRIKKDPQSVNDTYFNPYSWNQKVICRFNGSATMLTVGSGECFLLGSADWRGVQPWRQRTGESICLRWGLSLFSDGQHDTSRR